MKRKRHYISLGWVVVAVVVSIAIHAFSHQEVRQEESQEVTTRQQQSEGSWTTMPDSVVERMTGIDFFPALPDDVEGETHPCPPC